MYFTFLDNGLELHIKTNCSGYLKLDDWPDYRTFTFCQNKNCCSTGALPAPDQRWFQDHNCFVHKYKYKLGDCSKFNFDFDSVKGNVTYHFRKVEHGWRLATKPEWVKLVLGNATKSGLGTNGTVIKCSFDRRIVVTKGNKPTSMNFDCKPEGKVFLKR